MIYEEKIIINTLMLTTGPTTGLNGREEVILIMKISQAISGTTGPNIGMFVLILMHCLC